MSNPKTPPNPPPKPPPGPSPSDQLKGIVDDGVKLAKDAIDGYAQHVKRMADAVTGASGIDSSQFTKEMTDMFSQAVSDGSKAWFLMLEALRVAGTSQGGA